MEEVIVRIKEWLALYGLRVIAAVLVLIIGRFVAGIIRGLLVKATAKRKIDPTISQFVVNFAYVLLMTFVVLAALGQLGVQTTSFVAVIGAAGLAVGLALQGSLANFAAGFLMIIFRPFKKGDYIEGAGTAGIVEEIQVFTTILKTPDNKKVIIPNAKLTGDNIINYSANDTRRLDLKFGVSYKDDVKKVRSVLDRVVREEARVLKDPAPAILLAELGDSSVNFIVRVWVKGSDYWGVNFDTMEKVKLTFDAEGISIPFPQRDVHLFQEK